MYHWRWQVWCIMCHEAGPCFMHNVQNNRPWKGSIYKRQILGCRPFRPYRSPWRTKMINFSAKAARTMQSTSMHTARKLVTAWRHTISRKLSLVSTFTYCSLMISISVNGLKLVRKTNPNWQEKYIYGVEYCSLFSCCTLAGNVPLIDFSFQNPLFLYAINVFLEYLETGTITLHSRLISRKTKNRWQLAGLWITY